MPYSRLSSDISAVLPINTGPFFLYVIASYIIPSYNIASYNVIRQAAHAKGAVHHRSWTVLENESRSGAKNWAVVSAKHAIRKARPTPRLDSGTQFPLEARSGNGIPLRGRNLGRSFRLKGVPESASHSERQFRDIVSADTDDDLQPLSHAFKYAIQKHKTADRMLFFKKYTSRNLPRFHI